MKTVKYFSILAIAAAACACTKNTAPTIEGEIANATDTTIYVEASVMNNWMVVDSARLSGNGKFKMALAEAPATPSVYRLRLGQSNIYFPVDSLETITINADAKHFDRGYTIAGNIYAPGFVAIDSLVAASIAKNGAEGALKDENLKKAVNAIVNTDTTALVSYYAVGKFIGNKPLYRLDDRADVRVLANAANNYIRVRPDDPRAEELKQRWLEGRRQTGRAPQREVTMQAEMAGRPQADLVRYDRNGKKHDFEKVVTRGGVTILNLTRYDGENSPANTVALTRMYDKYKANGLEIFQVSYEPDEIAWKRSAANMPWIAVWNSPTDGVDALIAYNVDPIHGSPVSFIFNRAGELVARVVDPSELDAAVARAMN